MRPARVHRPRRTAEPGNDVQYMSDTRQKAVSFVSILGAFLVVAVLVYAMNYYTRPAPLNQARSDERKKALGEIRADNEDKLGAYGWQDQGKGLVRLRIDRAMDLTVDDYRNPALARASLIARAEKASVAPPKPPEPPSKFE